MFTIMLIICYSRANVTFVAGGTSGLYISKDGGGTWISSSPLPTCSISGLMFLPDSRLWFAYGRTCPFSYAVAGSNLQWEPMFVPLMSTGVTSMTYGGNVIIATVAQNSSAPFGNRTAVLSSADGGKTWTSTVEYGVFGGGSVARSSAYANGGFLVSGGGSIFGSPCTLIWSKDGYTWTQVKNSKAIVVAKSMAYSSTLNRWVLADTQLSVSSTPTNASSWVRLPNPLWPQKVDIYVGTVVWCADTLRFVLVGGRGGLFGPGLNQLATSADGLKWEVLADQPFGSSKTVLYVPALAYSPSLRLFLAGGQGSGSQFASSAMGRNGTWSLIPGAAPFVYNSSLSKFYTGPNAIACDG